MKCIKNYCLWNQKEKKNKFVDKENESDKSSEKFSIEYKIDENNIIRFKD
jgi:hypothetical protein